MLITFTFQSPRVECVSWPTTKVGSGDRAISGHMRWLKLLHVCVHTCEFEDVTWLCPPLAVSYCDPRCVAGNMEGDTQVAENQTQKLAAEPRVQG